MTRPQRKANLIADRFHPIANLFPLLEGEAFDRLMTDIKAHGLREPIVEYEGLILDGRNRYGACIKADVDPRFVRLEQFAPGAEPIAFVLSQNLHRRHLNESQRGMIAAALETLAQGRPTKGKDAKSQVSRADAAQILNVSVRTVADSKLVRDNAVPAIVKRVQSGEVPVSVAAKIATMTAKEQNALADEPEAKLRNAVKAASRETKERALVAATATASAALGSTLFGVIYADPPWQFAPRSRDTGLDRAADNHYPTLPTEAICAIRPPAADDAVCFMWATVPMLPQALQVLEAWGFAYRSHFVWVKPHAGTGYWNRNRHEILLLGVRGNMPAPAPGTQFDSVIEANTGRHSEKPAAFREMIEEMFPNTPPVEMFARGEPPAGWYFWGNEAGSDAPIRATAV